MTEHRDGVARADKGDHAQVIKVHRLLHGGAVGDHIETGSVDFYRITIQIGDHDYSMLTQNMKKHDSPWTQAVRKAWAAHKELHISWLTREGKYMYRIETQYDGVAWYGGSVSKIYRFAAPHDELVYERRDEE